MMPAKEKSDVSVLMRPGDKRAALGAQNTAGGLVKVKAKNGGGHFDVSALYSALDCERMARRLNWKKVSAQCGVSASTLSRLSKGGRPDVDSLAALTAWLGVPADSFMAPQVRTCGAASPLTQIATIIRADPNLNPDAAMALEELLKTSYARLRGQKPNRSREA
jgi:transcriptional regulator with XRE-family HTH domain